MSAAGNDSVNNIGSDNIIFNNKDTKLYVPVVTLSARATQRGNFLAKALKDQFIKMNIKKNVRTKIRQKNLDIFSNQIFLK